MLKEYNIPTVPTFNKGKNVQFINGKRGVYSGTIPPLGVFGLLDLANALRVVKKDIQIVNIQTSILDIVIYIKKKCIHTNVLCMID
jgi:hypothetical protein